MHLWRSSDSWIETAHLRYRVDLFSAGQNQTERCLSQRLQAVPPVGLVLMRKGEAQRRALWTHRCPVQQHRRASWDCSVLCCCHTPLYLSDDVNALLNCFVGFLVFFCLQSEPRCLGGHLKHHCLWRAIRNLKSVGAANGHDPSPCRRSKSASSCLISRVRSCRGPWKLVIVLWLLPTPPFSAFL